MAMPRRKPGENKLADLNAELEELRKDATKSRKDIVALKARIVDAEQRLAKAETALGTIGKSGTTPEVDEPVDPLAEQQPETE
jgi:predicted  nucleic acid-binding Zn-ribbon protein